MKLLHKVVKSSQGLNFDGVVSIDNTVVIKPKPAEELAKEVVEEKLPDAVEKVVQARVASIKSNLAKKEQQMVEEINLRKGKIISEAMTEAERVRRDAEIGAIVLREKAKDTGFELGKQEAYAQFESQLKATATLLSELNSRKEALYINQENELIDLAYDLVKKITLSEIKTDREIIFGMIKQACKSFRNSDYVKISVAKCDFSETVVTDEKLLKSISASIPYIDLELLPDAESGTILLDNDKEIIDASAPTQLKFLQEIMNAGKK